MGQSPCKPTDEEYQVLLGRLDGTCRKVAEALCRADVLLVCTGAGFSADSGLALYKDIAELEAYERLDIRYHDICRPEWLRRDPELFYGFWGTCYNDYRETQPHDGYGMLRRWKDRHFSGTDMERAVHQEFQEMEALRSSDTGSDSASSSAPSMHCKSRRSPYPVKGRAGAFYLLTSNVDAHSYDFFEPKEVREIHGNTEVWQCSAEPKPCKKEIWRAPLDFRFHVDPISMRAPQFQATPSQQQGGDQDDRHSNAAVSGTSGSGTNEDDKKELDGKSRAGHVHKPYGRRRSPLQWLPEPNAETTAAAFPKGTNRPVCPRCGGPARPAILMFGDTSWVDDGGQEARWMSWQQAVMRASCVANEYGRRVRIFMLEIGCGANVPTVRNAVEGISNRFEEDADVTVARINPDFPLPDRIVWPSGHMRHLSLACGGLEALRRINYQYEALQAEFWNPPDEPLCFEPVPEELSPPEPLKEETSNQFPSLRPPPRALPRVSASRSRSRSRTRSPNQNDAEDDVLPRIGEGLREATNDAASEHKCDAEEQDSDQVSEQANNGSRRRIKSKTRRVSKGRSGAQSKSGSQRGSGAARSKGSCPASSGPTPDADDTDEDIDAMLDAVVKEVKCQGSPTAVPESAHVNDSMVLDVDVVDVDGIVNNSSHDVECDSDELMGKLDIDPGKSEGLLISLVSPLDCAASGVFTKSVPKGNAQNSSGVADPGLPLGGAEPSKKNTKVRKTSAGRRSAAARTAVVARWGKAMNNHSPAISPSSVPAASPDVEVRAEVPLASPVPLACPVAFASPELLAGCMGSPASPSAERSERRSKRTSGQRPDAPVTRAARKMMAQASLEPAISADSEKTEQS